MPLIALASLKASPGVTTTALALAATWPAAGRRLLVEADPAGGDLGLRLGLPADTGLAGLAAAARHGHEPGMAWRHARQLDGEVHLVTAPAGAEQAIACVAALAAAGLPQELAAGPEPALADCGRLYPGSPALAVVAAAEVTLLVIRPLISELAHLEPRARGLQEAGVRLALVLAPGGRRPAGEPAYPAEEVSATLGIPVAGTLPDDPRAAGHLTVSPGDARAARRLPLLRAAASLAVALAADHAPAAAAVPQDGRRAGVSIGDHG